MSATPRSRRVLRTGLATLAAAAMATFSLVPVSSAQASTASHVKNPYSPAYHQHYRHGVVPTLATAAKMRAWAKKHRPAGLDANDLNYGGGNDGIGVTTGHPQVYLVFMGSEWGDSSTDGNGDTIFSNDPSNEAPTLQEMFKGLGTNGDGWSNVDTQYCEGIDAGEQSCPSDAPHVGYPDGGALAGVWADTSESAPAASATDLGSEAVRAAGHFGNTSPDSNRNAQYVILSATGANPDGFPDGGWCAWHDWNGDVGVGSPYGDIPFTNMPYVTDMGQSCGQDFVNSDGTTDGITMVEGHEYSETITDQLPAGGWTDSQGEENMDKCAWLPPGSQGGADNLSLDTGSFAMQGTWSNDIHDCAFSE